MVRARLCYKGVGAQAQHHVLSLTAKLYQTCFFSYRNVPVGVMYDLLVPEHEEPWSLTLHFRDFPTDTLPLFSGESDLRLAYFNSLKEAGHICNGTAQSVMEMVVGARDDLWRAVVQSDVDKAKARLRSIRLHGSSTAYTKVPVRLFIREVTGQHGYLSSYENVLRTSRPVAILAPESGTRTTLRDALLPLLMPSCSSEHNAVDDNVWGSKVRRLWVGGIEPSPDVALVDLHKELHCPDFFLYIVAHVNTPL